MALRALLFVVFLALAGFATPGGARAQVAGKVDDPKILIVIFDYDGLSPMVMQISFILYADGTFALLHHGASSEDADTFLQGRIAAADAVDLAAKAQADLGRVTSNLNRLADINAKGGFEVWYWNPADHVYWYTSLTVIPAMP